MNYPMLMANTFAHAANEHVTLANEVDGSFRRWVSSLDTASPDFFVLSMLLREGGLVYGIEIPHHAEGETSGDYVAKVAPVLDESVGMGIQDPLHARCFSLLGASYVLQRLHSYKPERSVALIAVDEATASKIQEVTRAPGVRAFIAAMNIGAMLLKYERYQRKDARPLWAYVEDVFLPHVRA